MNYAQNYNFERTMFFWYTQGPYYGVRIRPGTLPPHMQSTKKCHVRSDDNKQKLSITRENLILKARVMIFHVQSYLEWFVISPLPTSLYEVTANARVLSKSPKWDSVAQMHDML